MCIPLEGLEGRRLLSATTYFTAFNGKFFINGDSSDDNISVSFDGSSFYGSGKARLTVKDHDTVVFDEIMAGINSLYVYPKEGNDIVEIGTIRFHGATLVSTAGGNDTVNASSFMWTGPAIYTGDGDDTINVSVAADDLGAYVNSGAGDDNVTADYSLFYADQGTTVVGGAGDDAITFIARDPTLSPRDYGTNLAYGGDGNDTIVGSDLSEYLSGQAGNDSITAGGGPDFVSGGTGDDFLLTSGDSYDRILRGGGVDTVDADPIDQVL